LRSRKLFENGENIARKALDLAEAQAASDRLKLRAAEQRFLLEWGPVIDRDRVALIDGLLAGKTVLVRAELTAMAQPETPPATASVTVPGSNEPLAATVLSAAPRVDAKSQTAAWFLTLPTPRQPLPSVLAWDVGPAAAGEAETGVLIPAVAVVLFEGQAWIFGEGDEPGRFERKAVELTRALPGGWFAARDFKPGDRIVTAGAASLLADELKAQIEGD